MKAKKMVYAVLGTLILLFAGTIYAWSILSAPIAEEFTQISQGALSTTFTLTLICFCLGGFVSGLIAGKVSPRWRMLAAAVLLALGFFVTSRMQGVALLYLGYGVLMGFGAGFAYNAVMVTVPRWFPNHPALISGVLLMGFGFSTLVLGSLFMKMTPSMGWRGAYTAMAVAVAVIMLLGALLIKAPEEAAPKQAAAETSVKVDQYDVPPRVMVKKVSFWSFFLWVIFISAAGLAIISQAKPVAASIDPTLSGTVLAVIAGLISIFNGLGRILYGYCFDRIKWKKTLLFIAATCLVGGIILMVAFLLRSLALMIVGYIVIGISNGGAPTMCASVTRDFYGSKYYSVNFQIAVLNLLPASFVGTISGMLYDSTGSYFATMVMVLVCGIVAFPLLKLVRKDTEA